MVGVQMTRRANRQVGGWGWRPIKAVEYEGEDFLSSRSDASMGLLIFGRMGATGCSAREAGSWESERVSDGDRRPGRKGGSSDGCSRSLMLMLGGW